MPRSIGLHSEHGRLNLQGCHWSAARLGLGWQSCDEHCELAVAREFSEYVAFSVAGETQSTSTWRLNVRVYASLQVEITLIERGSYARNRVLLEMLVMLSRSTVRT